MEWIDSIDDPRVAAYRNLKERTLRGESIFVTEGRLVTLRLLESRFEAESVFVADKHAGEFERIVAGRMPVYAAPEKLLADVVGYNFHLGVLGAGRRRDADTLDDLLSGTDPAGPLSLLVCPEITKPENVGLVFRTAGGFGVDGVVLGPQCCDPFGRRCLRLSMGAVLSVPFVRSADLAADLRQMKDRWQLELVATVVDAEATPLREFRWPRRAALLFGNEYDGLSEPWLGLCDHRVTIPMHPRADSLNLGVAAGIFVYEMTNPRRPATRTRP